MRKLIIILIVALAVGIVIGQLMISVPTLVTIQIANLTIQLSLWLAVILLAIIYGVIYLLWQFARGLRHPWLGIALWNNRLRHKQAVQRSEQAFIQLSDYQFSQAGPALIKAAPFMVLPWVNYLAAAYAAAKQQNYSIAEKMLSRAKRYQPRINQLAQRLQAQWLWQQQQPAKAIQLLEPLVQQNPPSIASLPLLAQIYQQQQQWQALTDLLPRLKKYAQLTSAQQKEFEYQAALGLLAEAPQYHQEIKVSPTSHKAVGQRERLTELWAQASDWLKEDENYINHFVRQLAEINENQQAVNLLAKCLSQHWYESWLTQFGLLAGDAGQQLQIAQGWLEQHPQDPTLLLTLARLALRNQHWGQAQDYLQQSLALRPEQITASELARLTYHLGQQQQSQHYLAQAMALLTQQLPELPQPN